MSVSKLYSTQIHKSKTFRNVTMLLQKTKRKRKKALSTYTFSMEVLICLAHNRNSVIFLE